MHMNNKFQGIHEEAQLLKLEINKHRLNQIVRFRNKVVDKIAIKIW